MFINRSHSSNSGVLNNNDYQAASNSDYQKALNNTVAALNSVMESSEQVDPNVAKQVGNIMLPESMAKDLAGMIDIKADGNYPDENPDTYDLINWLENNTDTDWDKVFDGGNGEDIKGGTLELSNINSVQQLSNDDLVQCQLIVRTDLMKIIQSTSLPKPEDGDIDSLRLQLNSSDEAAKKYLDYYNDYRSNCANLQVSDACVINATLSYTNSKGKTITDRVNMVWLCSDGSWFMAGNDLELNY